MREVVGGSEAAVVVHQQFADAGAGLDERAEGVEGLGEGEGVLQRAAGRGPFAGGDRDRGFQQPGVDDAGSNTAADPSRTGRIRARACSWWPPRSRPSRA